MENNKLITLSKRLEILQTMSTHKVVSAVTKKTKRPIKVVRSYLEIIRFLKSKYIPAGSFKNV